jgi:hypothetical protein
MGQPLFAEDGMGQPLFGSFLAELWDSHFLADE